MKCSKSVLDQENLFYFNPIDIVSGKTGVIGRFDPTSGYQARRIMRLAEKTIRDLPDEHSVYINKRGKILHATSGKSDGIYDESMISKEDLYGAFGTHNHPKSEDATSYSKDDHRMFQKNWLKGLRSVDYKSTMSMHRTNRTPNMSKEIESLYDRIYNKITNEEFNKMIKDPNYVSNMDIDSKVHSDLAKMLHMKSWKRIYDGL